MSKLLDLLYREYTRSRMAEIGASDGFAEVWRIANYQRSADIAQAIGAALESEQQSVREQWRDKPAKRDADRVAEAQYQTATRPN